MKNFIIHLNILLLLLASGYSIFAQQESTTKHLQILSESEKAVYNLINVPQEQLVVNNYDLKYHRFFFFTDPAKTFFSGTITSYFVATQPDMSSIQFELASSMTVDSAYHNGIIHNVTHAGKLIIIPFSTNTAIGTLDSVTVYYHGNPTGAFGHHNHGGTWELSTLSEPFGASDWWPSKNDLTDKIDSIDVFVVTPKGNHVASNGLLISETPYGTSSTLAHWKHRYPIASYLIAIAATNYARFSDYYVTGNDSLQVLNYVYPEDSASLVNILATVLPSIELFEGLFGPYPFRAEKYGHAQYGFSDAMEHQTMTFMNKNAFNATTIAHELSHQWFGDMITLGSWHDIWLNEGFAVYCEMLRMEKLDPSRLTTFIPELINFIISSPGGSVYCDNINDAGRIFEPRLTYAKGAALLHMLRWVIGDDKFFEGMRNYANDPKLKYGFALTSDLKAHMEAVSGLDLTEFFADWFTGKGYPTYNVIISQSSDHNATVTINQSQSDNSVSFFEMPVPIKFSGAGKDTTIVFNHTFSGEMFAINPGFAIEFMKFDPDLRLISGKNTIIISLEGINDIVAGNELKLMPNPATDILQVKHNLGNVNSIEIRDIAGGNVSTQLKKVDNSIIEINTRNLKPGMYFIRINAAQGSITRKFLKE
jgi:aminopeptidase N